jgi:hypothetical protein
MIPKYKGCGWMIYLAAKKYNFEVAEKYCVPQMSSTLIKAIFCDF